MRNDGHGIVDHDIVDYGIVDRHIVDFMLFLDGVSGGSNGCLGCNKARLVTLTRVWDFDVYRHLLDNFLDFFFFLEISLNLLGLRMLGASFTVSGVDSLNNFFFIILFFTIDASFANDRGVAEGGDGDIATVLAAFRQACVLRAAH